MDASGPPKAGELKTREALVPTRRILILTVTVGVLMHPVMGLARLWTRKALGAYPPGTFLHGLAEAATIPTGVS